MKRLGELLDRWQVPGPAADDDAGAITEIAAVWAEVVGHEVARRTRPSRLRDGVLTVHTAGSTWSHQLSFLAPHIVQALLERVPRSGVKRLRFVVASGRTKALLDGAKAPAARAPRGQGKGSAGSVDAPGTIGDDPAAIVARLRERQHALDLRRVREGWTRCERCGSWRAPAAAHAACAVCDDAARRASDARVERMLLDAPWLHRSDVASSLPDDVGAFDRVKRRLSTRLEEQLRVARKRLRRGELEPEDRVLAWTFCMLLAGSPQSRIGRAVIVQALGPDWADALAGPARAAVREASGVKPQNSRKTTARVFTRRDTT